MNQAMGKQPHLDRCHRILVVNAKGGCGKTTVATNLCAAYAAAGVRVALVDNDGQGAGTHWVGQRPASAPRVDLAVQAHGRRPERIVIDGGPGAHAGDGPIDSADLVLTPVLPYPFDIRASGNFITEMMTQPRFRASPRPIGVIANRGRPNSPAHARLQHLLRCLNIPIAAVLHDSALYGKALEAGLGLVDLAKSSTARKEAIAWHPLMEWIEAHLPGDALHPQPLATGIPSQRQALSA